MNTPLISPQKSVLVTVMAAMIVSANAAEKAEQAPQPTPAIMAQGPLLKLWPQSKAPTACTAENTGLIAQTSTFNLCSCTGKTWVESGSGKNCTW